MRELWATIAHTSGAKIYAMVVGVFTLFLTARLLGPEGRGLVAAITTWVTLFGSLAHLSLGQVALHQLSENPDRSRFGNVFASLAMIAGVLTALGWTIAVGMHLIAPEQSFKNIPLILLAIGFLGLPARIWEQYGSFMLMGLEKVRLYNRYQVIGRTVSVALIFLLVAGLGAGVLGVLVSNLAGQIIVALGGVSVLIAYARRHSQSVVPSIREVRSLLVGGVKLHLNAVGAVLYASTDVLILNHFRGAEDTGYFQLAVQLIGVTTIVPQAAAMVLYGKVSTQGADGAWPINRKLLWQVTLGMTVVGGLAVLLSPFVIPLLAGEAFKPAIAPFQLMQLGLVGMTFTTMMAPQWIGRGYFWQVSLLTLLVGVLNVISNFILIPRYGINGAAYTYVLTYGISTIGNGVMMVLCQRTYERGAAK